EVVEAKQGDHLGHAPLGRFGIHAVHLGDELQELAARELVVQIRLIGHVADELPSLVPLADDVETADPQRAARGKEQADHELDGRGLAGAVGAKKGEQLAGLNAQVQVVDGGLGAVVLGDVVDFDHLLTWISKKTHAKTQRRKEINQESWAVIVLNGAA